MYFCTVPEIHCFQKAAFGIVCSAAPQIGVVYNEEKPANVSAAVLRGNYMNMQVLSMAMYLCLFSYQKFCS
jgi:hypothetical protein